jgi:hypothetical protein
MTFILIYSSPIILYLSLIGRIQAPELIFYEKQISPEGELNRPRQIYRTPENNVGRLLSLKFFYAHEKNYQE